MRTNIPPREDYYLHDGRFYLRSKWSKWLRLKALLATFIFGTFLTANAMFSNHTKTTVVGKVFAFEEAALIEYVQSTNKSLTEKEAIDIIMSMSKWSKEFKIDLSLIVATAQTESRFDKHAISSAGALGLMQVIPSWHLARIKKAKEDVGTPELFNIETNVYLGTAILKECIQNFKTVSKGLLCYNGSMSKPNGYDEKVLKTKNTIERYVLQNT